MTALCRRDLTWPLWICSIFFSSCERISACKLQSPPPPHRCLDVIPKKSSCKRFGTYRTVPSVCPNVCIDVPLGSFRVFIFSVSWAIWHNSAVLKNIYSYIYNEYIYIPEYIYTYINKCDPGKFAMNNYVQVWVFEPFCAQNIMSSAWNRRYMSYL